MIAWSLTDGLPFLTRNREMINRSNTILTKNFSELITNGTSGLSSARVEVDTAVSKAELKAEKALIRTYDKLAALTSTGTKPSAKFLAAQTKAMLMMRPRMHWKRIIVCARPRRVESERDALSPMMSHAARGKPSFRDSATTPM